MSHTRPPYPFAALVGQDRLRLALMLNVIAPEIGGLLVMGQRGSAKSTALRGLPGLLPEIEAIQGCPMNAARREDCGLCSERCEAPTTERQRIPLVDLPLGASDDRVVGSLDLEAALLRAEQVFEPGLLARAHRGFLYIDEVNLLEDHLVDLLLDVAAAGENLVERESLSLRHEARFVLVGSGNPEEGELRPQLLDRFGLMVSVEAEPEVERRVEIIRRRLRYDADPKAFEAEFDDATEELRDRLRIAREALSNVELGDEALERIASLGERLGVDGHRAELTMARAARAHAAWAGRGRVLDEDLREVAPMAFEHRLRRGPLEEGVQLRLEEALDEVLAR